MVSYFLSLISHSNNSPFAILLVLTIMGIIYLSKTLLSEKDKEIKTAQENENKVTLVLGDVNNTLQAILIDLRHHHHDEEEKS